MSSFCFSLWANVKHIHTHAAVQWRRCIHWCSVNLELWVSSFPPACAFSAQTVKTLHILQAHVWFLFKSQGPFLCTMFFFSPPPAEAPQCCIRSTIVWKINPNLCSSFQGSAESLFLLALVGGDVGFGLTSVQTYRGVDWKVKFSVSYCSTTVS